MKSTFIILICCILLILPSILFARCNEWARFSRNRYISSYTFQDSIHWIGTGMGLFKYNSNIDSLQHLLKINSIDTGSVDYIDVSDNGSIWFVTNGSFLFHYNEGNWTHYNSTNNDIPEGTITKIKTNNDDLFVIIDNRLLKFDGENWFCYPKLQESFSKTFRVNDIIVNKDIIWLHTTQSLAAYHNGKWQELRLQVNDYYHYNKNECLTQDPDGSLLFNFLGRINSVVLDSIITINPLENIEYPNFGNNFEFDNNGNFIIIKVSTSYSSETGDKFYHRDAIVYNFNNNKLEKFQTINEIYNGEYGIHQIEIDNNGVLWFHNRSGFYKFSNTKLKPIKLWDLVMPIHEISRGRYNDTIYPNYPGYSQDRVINGYGDLFNKQEEGHWTYTNSINQIMMEGMYEGGKRIGTWKKYFSNGSIYKKIEYENGFKDGYYVDYYENGNKRDEGNYSKSKKTGEWIAWFDNGNIKEIGEYENNMINGSFRTYDYKIDGNLVYKGKKVNNELDGILYIFSTNGAYGEIELVNGKEVSEWSYFNPNGEPIYSMKFPTAIKQPNKLNENGNKQGLWATFMWGNFKQCDSVEDATYYRIAEYDDGVPQGIVRDYYKDGTLQFEGKLISEFPSIYAGKIKIYNHSKLKTERTYIDKEKNGLEEIWDNNVLISKGMYQKGIKIGFWIETKIGRRDEGEYVNGTREYLWKTFYKGKQIDGKYYKKGRIIKPINLKEFYPTNLLKILEHGKVGPVIVNPIAADDWSLKLTLKLLMSKIDSKKEASPILSSESRTWSEGKTSTVGREAMYMLQGFIDGKYPPTECSVTDFDPDPEYYKKWWEEYIMMLNAK